MPALTARACNSREKDTTDLTIGLVSPPLCFSFPKDDNKHFVLSKGFQSTLQSTNNVSSIMTLSIHLKSRLPVQPRKLPNIFHLKTCVQLLIEHCQTFNLLRFFFPPVMAYLYFLCLPPISHKNSNGNFPEQEQKQD